MHGLSDHRYVLVPEESLMPRLRVLLVTTLILGATLMASAHAQADRIYSVKTPATDSTNSFYVSNRPPLSA